MNTMEPVRRLRRLAVFSALGLSVLAAGIAFIFDRVVAQGILLGGFAGVLPFWIMAFRLEKLASNAPDIIELFSFRWSFFRLLIYALALGRAYFLDPETAHGLIAAVGGLFVLRVVLIFLAFTGLDLPANKR